MERVGIIDTIKCIIYKKKQCGKGLVVIYECTHVSRKRRVGEILCVCEREREREREGNESRGN